MSDNSQKGIIACYYAINGQLKYKIETGGTVYIKIGKKHKFYLDASVDALFGPKTEDKNAVTKRAKWAYILHYAWKQALKTPDEEELPIWAFLNSNKQDKVKKLGIGTQYKEGSSIEFSPTNEKDIWLGSIYRMEVFNYIPNEGHHFYFMPVSQPHIRLAYFEKQKSIEFVEGVKTEQNFYSYGDIAILHMSTHLLPITTYASNFKPEELGIKMETKFENLELEIMLTGLDYKPLLEEPIILDELQKFYKEVGGANARFEIPILINPVWKDTIHTREEKHKWYFFTIKIRNKKTEKEYPSKDKPYEVNVQSIIEIKESSRDFETKEVSFCLHVKYDSMDVILHEHEINKSNQIQYIGDIDYSQKEYDPCGYSKIVIKDDEDTKRKPITIFDEDKLTSGGDKTKQNFDLVAGDDPEKSKKVTITVSGLKREGKSPAVFCSHVLLPPEEAHKKINNIFQLEGIYGTKRQKIEWQPFLGNYLEEAKKQQNKDYLEKQGYESEDDGDLQVKYKKGKNPEKGDEYENIGLMQHMVEGTDYTFNDQGEIASITLKKLNYIYNKSYDDKIANYLANQKAFEGGVLSDNFKNLWVIRYLLKAIKGEDLYQTYFVPISTCRYPNQIAKIRLFPDMKWVINFNYNIETPLYYKANTELMNYYSGFNEGKDVNTSNNNKRKDIRDKTITDLGQRYEGRKTSFGLSVECEVGGDAPFKLSKDFSEKYRSMLSPLLWIVNKLDNDLAVSDARQERDNLLSSRSTKKGLLARLESLPMSFELKPPSLGVGIGIGYAVSELRMITYELDGRLIADPVIEAVVKLDLLALGSKFKPWGAIIDALDLISWAADLFSGGSVGINYELYFQLSAGIKLVGTDSKDGEAKPANITYNFADKKYKGNIALQGYLEGKFVMSVSFEYKVLIEKGKQISVRDEEEKRRKAFELGIWVEGKALVTLTIGKNFGDNDDWDCDFYFSGVTLDVKIKAGGFNKEEKDLEITPRVDKKINIFKNEGEIK